MVWTQAGAPQPALADETLPGRLDRILCKDAPEAYAGAIDGQGGVEILLVLPAGAQDRERLLSNIRRQLGTGQEVRILPVQRSLRDLETAAARIVSALRLRPNVQLSRWGVDIATNRVVIGHVGGGDVVAAALADLGYDGGVVRVEQDVGLSSAF